MTTDLQNQIRMLASKASQLQAKGQWAEAVKVYSQIIKLVPDFAPAYVERGLLVHEMGNPVKAFRDFEKSINLDPQFGPGYYGRGWVRHSMGDYQGELEDARKGLLLDKKNAGMYYRRIGSAHQGLKQYNEAIDFYNQAIDFYEGKDEGTIFNRGNTYLMLKEFDSALADFNRCLELDPDWAWALTARGRTYIYMGEYKKAIADCNMAIKYQPNYRYSYIIRDHAYIMYMSKGFRTIAGKIFKSITNGLKGLFS